MKDFTTPATTGFSERTSGNERLLSDTIEARRNALTHDADRLCIQLEHHRNAGLRPSAEVFADGTQ